ncbi:MAG: hypothetical protein EP336_09610 [Rhodobacteraceae bacterium]|nr:MAG: hypothetical protein EP336_09610 [Paracoccaceae bacterium]
MTPDMMTDNLTRAQDRIKTLTEACQKVLPLIEAVVREEVTDTRDWDEAEAMIRAAIGKTT